jgi:hypothetical protein
LPAESFELNSCRFLLLQFPEPDLALLRPNGIFTASGDADDSG